MYFFYFSLCVDFLYLSLFLYVWVQCLNLILCRIFLFSFLCIYSYFSLLAARVVQLKYNLLTVAPINIIPDIAALACLLSPCAPLTYYSHNSCNILVFDIATFDRLCYSIRYRRIRFSISSVTAPWSPSLGYSLDMERCYQHIWLEVFICKCQQLSYCYL